MNKVYEFILRVIPAFLIIGFWQLIISAKPSLEFYLGSPFGIAKEMISLIKAETFQRDISITALEALLGFLTGTTVGTACGLALWFSKRIYSVTKPYITSLSSIPIFALGPILVFWFGTGMLSKIVLGFLSTFAIALAQAYSGASEADQNLQRLLKVFGAKRIQIFQKIIVPSATIWVLSGIRLNIGMGLLGAFIGEFIASNKGLGHLIILAEGLYNVNQIWVGVLGIMLIALTLSALTGPVEKWACRWQAN